MSVVTRQASRADSSERQRLQDLRVCDDQLQKTLYWRKIDVLGDAVDGADGSVIGPGAILRLDTFLNSFYERYWRDLTALVSLELSLATSGFCHIRVVRRSATPRQDIVAQTTARGERACSVLRIDLNALPFADTVLYAEIEALDEPVTFHGGTWETADPPRSSVRLAIVTCSFGRESMLVENIRRLADVIKLHASITEFLVVQQGAVELASFAPYAALLSDPLLAKKVRLIPQTNFGGTGGFVRGLLEALGSAATHVLLLDDDIKIEPLVVERLLALLAYLGAPTVIGGQMLDLHEPTKLHASHEYARLDALELRNPYVDIDLAHACPATLFGRRQLSGYNAWWFCCIPSETIRKIGLPVPMFLRHDDVEYGVRAVSAGVPVVTMPGIFVWHEPFTKKAKALTVYYEHRNSMITAALHGNVRRLYFVCLHWRNAWGALKRHRFEYCWARCRAVEDFLAGPASIFANLPGRHHQLTAAQARVTLMTMASVRFHSTAQRQRRMRWRLSITRLFLFGTRGLAPAEAAFAATIRELFGAMIQSSVALLLQARRAERRYQSEGAQFTSPRYWRQLLGMPSEDA